MWGALLAGDTPTIKETVMELVWWIIAADAVLLVVLCLMTLTGWATDDSRVYRKMQD